MDALILAAGRGSRLGSATADRPKTLVDLGGMTPLALQLHTLMGAGVGRAVIVTGYRRDQVEAEARRQAGDRIELEFIWNPFWAVTNVIGSAWLAWPRLTAPLVYLHADTVFEPAILDDLLAARGSAIAVDFRACEPEQMKVALAGERVGFLSKNMSAADTVGEFIGLAVFRQPSLQAIQRGIDAALEQGKLGAYFEEGLNLAISTAGLDIVPVPTAGRRWTEIDFPEDLEFARKILPALVRHSR